MNYATDLAINGLPDMINALPKGCLIPGEKGSMFESFPVGLSADQYYAMLPDGEGEGSDGQKGEGKGSEGQDGEGDSQGSHDGWGENDSNLSDAVKDIAKERLKNNIREAAKDATKKGWGSVGSDMRQEIMDRLSTSVDWRKTLRYVIKTSTRSRKFPASSVSIAATLVYTQDAKSSAPLASQSLSIRVVQSAIRCSQHFSTNLMGSRNSQSSPLFRLILK